MNTLLRFASLFFLAALSFQSWGLVVSPESSYEYDYLHDVTVVQSHCYDLPRNSSKEVKSQSTNHQLSVSNLAFDFSDKFVAAKSADKVIYIGKLDDLKNVPRNQTILDELSNLGSAKANWKQNSSVLRRKIREGYEIRETTGSSLAIKH